MIHNLEELGHNPVELEHNLVVGSMAMAGIALEPSVGS